MVDNEDGTVAFHGLRQAAINQQNKRLWKWSRMTAYRSERSGEAERFFKVKAVMEDAGLDGVKATPKGLRHAKG